MQKLFTVFAFSLCFIGCSDNKEGRHDQESQVNTPSAPPQSKLDQGGTERLMTVVSDYYELKDALVATNADKANTAAGKLMVSTDSLRSYVLQDSNATGLLPLIDSISIGSRQITDEKDPTAEKQRIPFEKVSDAMYALLKQADLKNGGVYRQYCPMAFNDKGAYWLSNEMEIRNPYFGKKMLECGEVTDSLK